MVDTVVCSPDIPNEQPVTKVAKKTPSATPSKSTPCSDKPFSMTNCISELKKMNGLLKSIQIKAISALTVEVWREAFMNMDVELRQAWLESLEPGFKIFKPAPTFHGGGDSVQPVTDTNINETEIYPSWGKAPDVLNEMIPSAGEWENVKIVQPGKEELPSKGRKTGQVHKKSGNEVQQQGSAAQLSPNRTKPLKTTALTTRSSDRLVRIKVENSPGVDMPVLDFAPSCEKSDELEAVPTVNIDFVAKIKVEKPPAVTERIQSCRTHTTFGDSGSWSIFSAAEDETPSTVVNFNQPEIPIQEDAPVLAACCCQTTTKVPRW